MSKRLPGLRGGGFLNASVQEVFSTVDKAKDGGDLGDDEIRGPVYGPWGRMRQLGLCLR